MKTVCTLPMPLDTFPGKKDCYTYVVDFKGVIRWLSDEPNEQSSLLGTPLWDDRDIKKAFGEAITGNQTTIRQDYSFVDGTVETWVMNFRPLLDANAAVLLTCKRCPGSIDQFTCRESEVLSCLRHGQSIKSIAETLDISCSTVENHIGNLKEKTRSNTRHQLVVFAIKYFEALEQFN